MAGSNTAALIANQIRSNLGPFGGTVSHTQFCRLAIYVQPGREFLDANNQVVNDYPLQVGTIFYQWADPSRAMGWFAEAGRLLSDQTTIDRLNAAVNTSDEKANATQVRMQLDYVQRIFTAIMRGYNLLNVPWHNDPVARQLYRKYLAGPPAQVGNNISSSVFGSQYDYNPNWYTKDKVFPGMQAVSPLQQQALRLGKPGDQFGITVMPVMGSLEPLTNNATVSLAQHIYNGVMVRTKQFQVCPVGTLYKADGKTIDFTSYTDFPWNNQCSSTPNGLAVQSAFFGSTVYQGNTVMPDGKRLDNAFDDWRAIYQGPFYPGFSIGPQQSTGTTCPLIQALPWAQEWVGSLLSRNAGQIIQDVYAYTAWQNLRTLAENPSAAQIAAGLASTISAQQHSPNAGAQIAATSIAAVGGALAVATYGISAVIGGIAAAAITVGDALSNHGTQGIGRDDLGRYKPVIERSYLSGDSSTTDVTYGAPVLPASELVDPPGLGVTWQNAPCDVNQYASPSSGGGSGLKLGTLGWIAVGLGAVVLIYVSVD